MGESRQTLTRAVPWSAGLREDADVVRVAGLLLRFAVVAHAAGVTVSLFSGAGSPIGSIALMQWGASHEMIFLLERIVSAALLALAVSLFFYPATISLLVISAAIVADAWTAQHVGGEPYAEYALLTHGLRFLLPLALIAVVRAEGQGENRSRDLIRLANWILRVGLATIFFMHGMEALWHHPGFIDLIIGSAWHLVGVTVGESAAIQALNVIGAVDVLVALLLLIKPWRALLMWMCFWGLATALSRPIAMGFASYPDVLVRASHFLSPLAIALLLLKTTPAKDKTN